MGLFSKIFEKKEEPQIANNAKKAMSGTGNNTTINVISEDSCRTNEKVLPSLEEMKQALLNTEEKSLHNKYPNEDGWRAPRNMADTMGCVGYAAVLLDHYKHKLETMSEKEIITLYRSTVVSQDNKNNNNTNRNTESTNISKDTVEKGVRAADLPDDIRDIDFNIDLKNCCTLKSGSEVLERFVLHKAKYSTVSVSISIGFGYSCGSHNPGVGWSFEIPSVYFKNCDIYGLSRFISQSFSKYSNIYINENEICKNDDILTLFEIIRESEVGSYSAN